jgi:hypothetical protein
MPMLTNIIESSWVGVGWEQLGGVLMVKCLAGRVDFEHEGSLNQIHFNLHLDRRKSALHNNHYSDANFSIQEPKKANPGAA